MRKIIHIDMDAFYAQVEVRDNPNLQGKPIIIGSGDPYHGVVSTCSYEARAFGVRSAMANAKAYKLCPHAVFIRQNNKKYKYVSKQIFKIFEKYTDIIQPLSIDEAFLDVTTNKLDIQSATIIAKMIKEDILKQTKLTASAGVSYNMMLAKLGSDYQKPNGLTVISKERAIEFINSVSLRDIYGIGKSLEKKMNSFGIYSVIDLRNFSREECLKYFGSRGSDLYDQIRGIDNRVVMPSREQKSIANETTLHKPYDNIFDAYKLLEKLTVSTIHKLEQKNIYAKTFNVKIKYGDFSQYTRSVTVDIPSNIAIDFTKHINSLLFKFPYQNKQVRLIGISFSNLYNQSELTKLKDDNNYIQTKLF